MLPSSEIRGPVMPKMVLSLFREPRCELGVPSRGGLVFKTVCDGVKLVQVWNLYRSPPCMRMTILSQLPHILWHTHGPKSGKVIKVGAERGGQPQPSRDYHVSVGVNVVRSSSSSNLTYEPVWTMKSKTTHRTCLTRKLLKYFSNLHTVSTLCSRRVS